MTLQLPIVIHDLYHEVIVGTSTSVPQLHSTSCHGQDHLSSGEGSQMDGKNERHEVTLSFDQDPNVFGDVCMFGYGGITSSQIRQPGLVEKTSYAVISKHYSNKNICL